MNKIWATIINEAIKPFAGSAGGVQADNDFVAAFLGTEDAQTAYFEQEIQKAKNREELKRNIAIVMLVVIVAISVYIIVKD